MAEHLCLLGDASSVHLQRWALEMRRRDFRVSVVTARPQPIDDVEQVALPEVRRSSDWLWRVGAARRAVEALAPDLVHAHYVTSYGWLAARCGRRPLVMTAWGSDLLVTPDRNPWLRALTGWTLRRADLVTGDSRDLVAAADGYRLRRPAQQIHWGVDLARFDPTPWHARQGFEIVSLRSWEPNYRIDIILDAVAVLHRTAPGRPLRLHLLGGGTEEAALRARATALGLLEVVVFHGRLDDAGMAAVMGRCKASVSVPASDATSVSVLESMAAGVPVVASDLPANREWLGAEPRLIVPVDDVASLATALGLLRDNDNLARQVGEAQHEHMVREGSRDRQMDRMVALYASLCRRHPKPS